ncbi:MAG: hypothetical protein KGL39_34855 [Patescibacteria group bacterium]|nr:hypothetical protein [Patescibacteria group bacterium]
MALAEELTAIFAGVEALAPLSKEFNDVAAAIEAALPTADRKVFESLLKSAAAEAVALAHGDSPIAHNVRADLRGMLHGVGHAIGFVGHETARVANDVADAVDPTLSTTVTATVTAPVKVEETAPPSEPKA